MASERKAGPSPWGGTPKLLRSWLWREHRSLPGSEGGGVIRDLRVRSHAHYSQPALPARSWDLSKVGVRGLGLS